MDDKLLINEVKKYEFLFNSESEDFNDPRKRKKTWIEISEKLKSPVRYCSNRWKNLRHRFVKTYQRSLEYENVAEIQKKWDLFKDLTFLEQYIKGLSSKDPLDDSVLAANNNLLLRAKPRLNYNQTSDEFDPELIEEVKKYPILYDKNDCNYFDKTTRKLSWNEIGEHLNISGEMAKKRWRVLRDHFVRDFNRKQSIAASNISGKPPIVWELYDKMLFLKDYIETNIIPDPKNCENLLEEAEEDTLEPEALTNPNLLYRHLINEVKKYKCLLSVTSNPTRKRQIAWMKISAKLNHPPLVLSRKWRYLRNRFIKEYNNNSNSSEWKLFDDLLFLKDYIKKKSDDTNSVDVEETPGNLQIGNLVFVEENFDSTKDLFPNITKNAFYTQLIKEVRRHDVIYNPMNRNYKNTRYLAEIWNEISVILNKPVNRCRSRWHILRDRFIQEFVHFEKYGHYDELCWEFFDDLMFLKDFIYLRRKALCKEEVEPLYKSKKILRYWDQINCEKLILEIRKRPELYNPNCAKGNYKQKRFKLWNQISKKMNFPVNYCQIKWRGLRKRFTIELKKRSTKNKKDDGKLAIPSWSYFHQMEFLTPFVPVESFNLDSEHNEYIEEWLDEEFLSEIDSCSDEIIISDVLYNNIENEPEILFNNDFSKENTNINDSNTEKFKTLHHELNKSSENLSIDLPSRSSREEENPLGIFTIENSNKDTDMELRLSDENKKYLNLFENNISNVESIEYMNDNKNRSQDKRNVRDYLIPSNDDEVVLNLPKTRDGNLPTKTHGAENDTMIRHLNFLEKVSNKLKHLSRDDQEEAKMVYLNHLHKLIKKGKNIV